MTHIALKLEAQRLRREELGRIARLIAQKWSTFLESPCPAPAPKPCPASLAGPAAG